MSVPISYELKGGVVWFRAAGVVDHDAGLVELDRALAEARDRAPTHRWLLVFDIREYTKDCTLEELSGVAVFVAERDDVLAPRCLVVASDPLHFGLARMFEAYAEQRGIDVHVVRNDEDARAFIASWDE